jgi:hypothetical protein
MGRIHGLRRPNPFWPDTVITDFRVATDVLGLSGLGLSFKDVMLNQSGTDTVIQALGKDIAVLSGVQATSLSASSFVFI